MRDTGVTVMRIDEELDHGPMLAQKEVSPADWPLDSEALGRLLAREGGALIAEIVPQVIAGTARETPQDHAEATFSRKIEKEDGLIDLSADAYENLLKVKAYKEWPTAYFFAEKGGKKIRITIKDASEKDGIFTILRAIPEGKKEMSGDELSRFLAS
jgi:methionyl-tRNA formyltransferase